MVTMILATTLELILCKKHVIVILYTLSHLFQPNTQEINSFFHYSIGDGTDW